MAGHARRVQTVAAAQGAAVAMWSDGRSRRCSQVRQALCDMGSGLRGDQGTGGKHGWCGKLGMNSTWATTSACACGAA